MTTFFGDDYVTQITDIVFDPTGGQFGPDVDGFNYSEFFGVGEDDLIGDVFSIGGPVVIGLPFVGDVEIFRARLFGEIGAQFGLQINSTLDPGSVDAILPYETVVGYPDFDIATIEDGDVVDLFFGATFDPSADPDSGFTTQFPRFTFDIGILTELVVELGAEIGVFGNNTTLNILDFNVPETVLPIFSVDTGRDITAEEAADNDALNEGDANPIEVFGITTPELVNEVDGLNPAFNDQGEFAGIGIPLNVFASDPATQDAEMTDASPEGDETPDEGPGFDLTSIDLGSFEIFIPDINTVSELLDGVFVTDPTRRAEYNFLEDAGGNQILDEDGVPILLSIDRVEDLAADGVTNLGEGNRDDLARLTLDLDGLITYATGGTFPPLELDIDLIDGSFAGINLDAGFSYNLLDVELEAALPLEQEFTLTPRLQTGLRFFENDDGVKGEAKPVEVLLQQQVLRFDESGSFQDEAVTARLRELAEGNAIFAQDIDLFLNLDEGISGGFTGQTASIGGTMIISRDGGRTWVELNNGDIIAESAPALGQDQTAELELAEGTLLGYRLFIGSGSLEVIEDYVIDFDETDSVYVENVEDTSSFLTETPFLDDLNTLNIIYDDQETFVEIVSQAVPIVTNRTGLEFDLALILRGLAASAFFEASIDVGPFTIGAGLDFEIGPLFEERFELLNLDIIDLFNDSFQLQDTETTNFILGAPAPETDFGDAIVGTTGNDTLQGTPDADIIIGLAGNDTLYGGDGDDLLQPGDGTVAFFGGDGYDTLSFQDIQGTPPTGNQSDRQGVVYSLDEFGDGPEASVSTGGGTNSPRSGTDIEHVVLSPFADGVSFFFFNSPGPVLPEQIETLAGDDSIQVNLGPATPTDLAVTIDAGAGDDRIDLVNPTGQGVFDLLALDGGDGVDTLETAFAVDLSTGLSSNGVRLANIENVLAIETGTPFLTGDDEANLLTSPALTTDITLDGRGGNDVLEGGEGNDVLIGGAGADSLDGGDGIDTADYSDSATSVFVDLDFGGVGRGFRGEAQGDELIDIENVIGSDFEDILFGDDEANTLTGGLGDDRLQTQGSNDLLQGGADNDLLNRSTVFSSGSNTFGNVFDGGEGFDLVAVDVFSPFTQTGIHTGTATFRHTFGDASIFGPEFTRTTTRSVTIDHRYVRSAHVELALDEDGNGLIEYVEDDATDRFLATRIRGTADYSSRGAFLDFIWDARTSSYNNNIADQSLSDLRNDSISFPRPGDIVSGTGRITSAGSAPAAVEGGVIGTEQVINVEGLIGSRGNDVLTGNSQANAFFGNGGDDIIRAGLGDDTLGFGEAQALVDVFSFPGSASGPLAPGGGGSGAVFFSVEERLQVLDPNGTGINPLNRDFAGLRDDEIAPIGRVEVAPGNTFVDVGSLLLGQGGEDVLDLRFDRGLDFFPDTSTSFAVVDLNIAGPDALINDFTGEALQYGRATYFDFSGNELNLATTFGVHNVIGTRNNDTITGDREDNSIAGMDGADVLDGDEGFDTASYALADEGVVLNFREDSGTIVLDNARATITGAGDATGDFADNFEAFIGSDHDDIAVIEGGALSANTAFNAFPILPQIGSTPVLVTGLDFDPENLSRTLEIDLGDGDDTVVLEGLGAHDVALGDGEDTAIIRNIGHTIDAGAGNDTITVLDHEDLSLAPLDAGDRVTTIDGGEGEDVVVFSGDDYVLLEITDAGAIVTERIDPFFDPTMQTFFIEPIGAFTADLTQTPEFQAEEQAALDAVATYALTNIEIVEINGERVRIDNPDPIVDPDTTLTIAEDQIDAYDLDLLITQADIDAGATFEILEIPTTAALVPPGGAPLIAGEFISAADLAALQVVAGQNFDPATDTVSYIRVGDDPEDARTVTLPEPVRGVALNITSHLEEVEVDVTPPVAPESEIALARLNPAPVVGDGPTVDEIQYADGGIFSDIPSGSVTVEFLFRSAGAFDPNGPDFSFLSYAVGGNDNELTISATKDDRGLILVFNGVGINTGYRLDQLFDQELHRISVTYDTTANQIELFVDGISVFQNTTPPLGSIANDGFLVVGQEQDAFGGGFDANQIVKGDLGDIRIWDGVRTDSEIVDNAFVELADPAADVSLAAYWQADPANQGALINAVGDTHLTLVNSPEIVTVSGVEAEAEASNVEVIPTIRVNVGNTTNEYIQVANFSEIPTGPMTVEFLYQSPEDFTATGPRQHLLSYAVNGSNNEFLLIADQNLNGGNIGLILNSTQTVVTNAPSSLLLDTNPHRVSVLFDPDADTLEIYIDGALAGSSSVATSPISAGGSLIIGQEQDAVGGGFNPNESIAGDFGDIRIWDGLRTPEQIAANAFTQLDDPANEPGLVANWQVDPDNASTVPNLAGGPDATQVNTPARGTVQFDLPDTIDAPDAVQEPVFETRVVDQQGDPAVITALEVPDNGTVFYLAPDPVLLQAGFTLLIETPVAVGDTLTPDQLEGLFFRADEDFSGDAGVFRYEVRDDVAFRDLSSTTEADQNNATDAGTRDGVAEQTIFFAVTPANDAPEVLSVLFPISPGAELRNALRVADAEGNPFEVELLDGPDLGSVTVNPDGTFTYVQDGALDFGGAAFLEDRFTVQATETFPAGASFANGPARSAPQEQVVRIINPAQQAAITFDPDDPDFFDEDGNPIRLGGLETNDVLIGHDGTNGLFGFGGDDSIFGNAGNDTVDGGLGDDFADGGEGEDTLSFAMQSGPGFISQGSAFGVLVDLSMQGIEQITGAGTDTFINFENLEGSDFADLLTGDDGANTLIGHDGGDLLIGGEGDDLLEGGADNDVLDGGEGMDTADFSDADGGVNVILFNREGIAQQTFASGRDVLIDIENITGSDFDDRLIGDAGANTIHGGDLDDTIDGVGGNDSHFGGNGNDGFRARGGVDIFDGGAGTDFVNFNAATGVNAFLDGSGTNGRAAVGDMFVGIENLVGSLVGGDLLFGNEFANRLTGLGGDDTLRGRAGNDQLEGGDGDDTLIGDEGADVYVTGAGADTIIFNQAPNAAERDRITDFTSGEDILQIDVSVFGGGLVAGGTAQLVANGNPVANAAGGTFLYDTDNGTLRFDADGNGAGGAVLFAFLQNVPSLAVDDFDFIA